MISAIIGSIWPYLLAAGGAIAALVAAYAKGRKAASDRARMKAAEKTVKDLQTAKEARDEVDGISDDDVSERLHGWRRD